jgi:hypothetical protein
MKKVGSKLLVVSAALVGAALAKGIVEGQFSNQSNRSLSKTQEIDFEAAIRENGLEKTLVEIAGSFPIGKTEVDDLYLIKVVAKDSQISIFYVIDIMPDQFSFEALYFNLRLPEYFCKNGPQRSIVMAGATIKSTILRRNSSEYDSIIINRKTCGF